MCDRGLQGAPRVGVAQQRVDQGLAPPDVGGSRIHVGVDEPGAIIRPPQARRVEPQLPLLGLHHPILVFVRVAVRDENAHGHRTLHVEHQPGDGVEGSAIDPVRTRRDRRRELDLRPGESSPAAPHAVPDGIGGPVNGSKMRASRTQTSRSSWPSIGLDPGHREPSSRVARSSTSESGFRGRPLQAATRDHGTYPSSRR
jgi:hypothetical protein